MGSTGVVLTGFGGPESIESVRPFMCNLMNREPSDELVASVCRRYEIIGGGSPLPAVAAEMAAGIEARLADGGSPAPVRVGMRYWHPFISEAVDELVAQGCDRVVTVSLSPFESKAASGACRLALDEAADACQLLDVVEAPLLAETPEFAAFFAESASGALDALDTCEGAVIVFTAHSLPESDLVENDPYKRGLRDTADAVADALGLAPGAEGATGIELDGPALYGTAEGTTPWCLVYQSKGARPGAWLGPQLDEFLPAAAAAGFRSVVVVPIGFATDHMETLYDLDVVAAQNAADAGLEFARAAVPNADPRVLDALTRLVTSLI